MRFRRRGGLTAPPVTPAIPDTLAASVAAFLQHLAARAYAQGSLDAHHWALKGFLEWTDSQNLTSPAAFTRATIEDYQLHLHRYRSPRTKEPLVVNTQLARLGAIRRFFAWLCRSGAIPANPASDLDLPRKQSRRLPKCLSTEEIDRLLALPNTADPFGLRDRAILELFYATGIRRTEMTKLDHGDYDASACTLLIRHGKNDKSRLLPVGERAAFWLDRFLSEARPLFDHLPNETAMFLSGYGMRITPAYLGTWVAGQMKKAGVTKAGSCHLMRHSMATEMHCNGADIRYVQEMLGHARLETTQIYTHVNIRALAEVHARCHPHGRLPSDSSADGSDASNEIITKPERPPAPPASGNSKELSSCFKPDYGLSTVPAMTAVMPHPAPTLGPPDLGSQGPGDDDPPAGIGTRRRPTRPRSPGPLNSRKPLACNRLPNNHPAGKPMHVACYGYRFYDPLTGRWHSKDPIGERGVKNLYGYVLNEPIGWIDILGLAEVSSGDRVIRLVIRGDSSIETTLSKSETGFFDNNINTLKEKLQCCCVTYTLACGIDIEEGYSKEKPPAPAEYNRYDPETYTNVIGQYTEGIVQVTITRRPIMGDSGGGMAAENAGVILQSRPANFALIHELGHVAGYDSGELEDRHHDAGNKARNPDERFIMDPFGGNKLSSEWCKSIDKLARKKSSSSGAKANSKK